MQLLCLLTAMLAIGCKDGEKPTGTQDARIDSAELPHETVHDKPASGWMGTYAGTLPCWKDCDGLKTEIEVRSDSTYSFSSQALGQEDRPRVFGGTYHFDTAKNTITLDAEGDHLKFLVQDGMLKKLDKFGDPEQGAPQENYLLKRVE
jgi:uncharacterized lipoprotein NlpE involved in copper resistance